MAATRDRVMFAAGSAKPYVERALRDEEFRDNLRSALAAARAIYEELNAQRGFTSLASRVATDEDIHSNLRRAVTELRQAADRLQVREHQHRSRPLRSIGLVLAGVAIGVFFNPFTGPSSRRWVKHRVTTGGNGNRPSPTPNSGYGAAA